MSHLAGRVTDLVVTVPKQYWEAWLAEGDMAPVPGALTGDQWSGRVYDFYIGRKAPVTEPGARVYVVAHDRLRGWAPLVYLTWIQQRGCWSLVRHGGAFAVTIPERIRGFRYRWWDRQEEQPFHDWRTP